MTTSKAVLIPLEILPGVQPSTDKTALATKHYTAADKIRFRFGFPQKIGGWNAVSFAASATVAGKARSLFSTILSTAINTVIGTNTKLYSVDGSVLTNITPLQTSTTAIANSLATDFGTLANNPITTVNGSGVITIADANASKYIAGDTVTLSGSSTVNGILDTQINIAQKIHTVAASSYTIVTAGTANASSSGGGAAVVRATGRIIVTAAAHGMANGERTKIAGAANTGGIVAVTNINVEFIIRNVAAGTFDIMTAGTATSSVSGAGGAGTTYQKEIATGAANQSLGQGYGMGKYGVGLYGTALTSSSSISYPRIWFMDRFGTTIIMTAGIQTGLYSWSGSINTAPALVTNAPTAINYAFVSDNIIVTFGAGGIVNRIFTSDQAAATIWTASSTNQVFDYTVNGASQLISHVSVSGVNLIFTDHQTYLFSYLGFQGNGSSIWKVLKIEDNIGIIGPMARCTVAGVAYWMDTNNFYMWAGGNVTIIPANSQEQSTILNYVYKNINRAQSSKFFAWYNEQFDEIWFHYASASSNECDRVARLQRQELIWVPDTFDRICAEYPNLTLGYPRLINSSGVLYSHENGVDDNGAALPFSITTPLMGGGKKTQIVTGIVPDSVQTGNIAVEIISKQYPQSPANTFDTSFTVSPTTEVIPVSAQGRYRQYTVSGSAVGQTWQAGQWQEWVQEGSNQ
jgi:hypothetical protein